MNINKRAFRKLLKSNPDRSKVDDGFNTVGDVNLILNKADTGRFVARRYNHNDLSRAGKGRAVAKGGEFIGYVNPYLYGKAYITGDVYTVDTDSVIDLKNTGSNPTTLYLLNLDGIDVNADSTFIPIYKADGSLNRDVVLARLNGNTATIGDDFTGVALPDADTNGILQYTRYSKHLLDKGKGTGTITHAAMMPGKGTTTDTKYTGSIVWKCACKTSAASAYAPPSTPGITEANEIMIFNTLNGVAGYKINLDTGDTFEVASSLTADAIGWDGSSTRYATLLFDTNKLAVIDGTTVSILQINGDGTTTSLFSKTFNYGVAAKKGLFLYNGYLWVSAGNTSTVASYYMRIDLSAYTSSNIKNDSLDILGGLPATWTLNSTVVYAYHNAKYYVANLITGEMIVCTDIADICGTIVGTYNAPFAGFGVISTTNKSDIFITHTMNTYSTGDTNIRVYDDYVNETYSNLTLYNTHLIWISDNMYANFWTLCELTSPMTKAEDETLTTIYTLSFKT